MVFSYNWLQNFFKRKLPKPEKLADLLTMKSFEVKEVKKSGDDWVLDIDVLPNRAPDCFSHLGIAREIAAITGFKMINLENNLVEDKKDKAKEFVEVKVENKGGCPRYTARVVTDVKVRPSPKWLRDKLEVCGLRSINNIVDITNYVMMETGQPLHAFDGEKLEGKKILVRFAREGEKITTLDNEKYDLDEDILVIADAKKPIAIAGIKGGKSPEIDNKTKIVILESANFNCQNIRRTSKLIDLKTDASLRFEHGIDPNLTEFAINRAAFLMQKIAGGKIKGGLIDFYSQKVLPKKIILELDLVEKLMGLKIPLREVKTILDSLGFKIKIQSKNVLEVSVPTYRLDILLQEDLIEEISRLYGYEKISLAFPNAALFPPKRNLDIFWEEVAKNILGCMGFIEVYNYSFVSEKDTEIFKYKNKELFELENPISSEFQYLRPSLIPNLLKNIEKNQKNFSEMRIFELGKIFEIKEEKKMLSGAFTGESFYQVKGAIDVLLNEMGISDVWYGEYEPKPEDSKLSIWRSGKCAEVKINDQKIGFLGEISQEITAKLKIEPKVVAFDLDFDKLIKLASEEHEYRPISRYPEAIRDIAVLVPREVSVENVSEKIGSAEKNIIRDIELFDIYEGGELPEGKKNLAFHIIYQASDRTLSSKEIDDAQQKIIEILESDSEWRVRR